MGKMTMFIQHLSCSLILDYTLYICIVSQVVIAEAFALCRYEWMRNALKEFLKAIEKEKNKREHETSVNGNKEDKTVTKEDEDCQLMSNNCYVNGTMSTYGIMVPASIFL